MKKPMAASLFLFLLTLSACSSFLQTTPTLIPTVTFTVAPTPVPTGTPDRVTALLPEEQPTSQWKGIPIMPGAVAGEGDEESYVFTVRATPQQVQAFYQLELGKLGWQLLGTSDGDSSLMFMNSDSATLTISIIAKGDQVLVLLVE